MEVEVEVQVDFPETDGLGLSHRGFSPGLSGVQDHPAMDQFGEGPTAACPLSKGWEQRPPETMRTLFAMAPGVPEMLLEMLTATA